MNHYGVDTDALIRLLVALALGAAVGAERELSGQTAGLRTHIAVCVGAALFGVVSTLGFNEIKDLETTPCGPTSPAWRRTSWSASASSAPA